jgi:hypothetical protein
VNRAVLVSVLLVMGGVASAGPAGGDGRPAPAPAPDGLGVHARATSVDNRRIVGVLDVRIEGLTSEIKESFQKSLDDQFDTKAYWLASHALMRQRLSRSTKWVDGCITGPCLAEVRAQTGAEIVLLASLTGGGTSFEFVVTLVRTDTGRVVDQEANRCEVCRVGQVIGDATEAVIGMLNRLPDKLPDEAAEQAAAIDLAVGKVRRELTMREHHTSRLGTTLTVVGLAAAVTGAVLYALDTSRASYAVPIAAGGGAFALAGITVLAF